ncbi:hypothetical protein HYE67_004043 [Fusarium culmorum]|uniref:Actin-like ATPase domain-containing protein n=1 Tax=Fusarium culmorum TaxID=5516 RepID=A0A7S8HUD5_FUSCU|nr:hypothetical protein HYE67_004043 [Fusarium culmorum]
MSSHPDLRIGVDFGATFTEPATYQKESSREVRGPWIPEIIYEVYGLVVAYLGQIYIHISNIIPELIKQKDHVSATLRNKTWDSMKVEFVFSTPAQWEAPVSQCFKRLIFRSGFDKINNHSVVLGLTEAEAAAYHTCNAQKTTGHQVQNDSIILSIDAGGGTTDLAFVKKSNDSVTLEQISPVTGIGVGSIRIDSRFAKLIKERMEKYPRVFPNLPADFPVKASQSNGFQDWKHRFGSDFWEDRDVYSTTVAGANGYMHKKFRIHDGELFFTRAELKGCFDESLEHIKKPIHDLLEDWTRENQDANKAVDYIVLSGGLGGSDYVLKELEAYINFLAAKTDTRLVRAQVLRAPGDTRTAVISGLLDWRNENAQALREYTARANYGIVVRNLPESLLSNSEFIAQDWRDGRIEWKVKSGRYIKYFQPITVKLTKYFDKNDPWTWTEEIVWVDKEERILPPRKIFENHGGEVLYRVDLEVVEGSTKLETVTSFMDSMVYLKCDFELALMIGPSGDCRYSVKEYSQTDGKGTLRRWLYEIEYEI